MLTRLFVAMALCLSFTAAMGAQNERVHVYGPITKVEGRTVTVANMNGQTVTFELAEQGRIVSDQPLDVKTIKVGDAIAFSEIMGKPSQVDTQPFPHGAGAPGKAPLRGNQAGMRYLGMVTAATPTANGIKLKVTLQKGAGEVETELTNEIAIRFIHQPETLADVKPGVTILANPAPNAEGKLSSGFNQIETRGHKPIDLD
jgi:ABC-type Fe3+-hydroxamate transport system substrate-binding protein